VPPTNLFQYFVWELLSVNALPARRDLAWLALRKIPALTPDAMFRAAPKAVLDAVGLTGPHRDDKVDRIRVTVGEFKRFRDRLDSDTMKQVGLLRSARAMRRLSQLDKPARARALLFAAGHVVLPIDDDVSRVVTRLMGEPNNRNRRAARRWLAPQLTKDADAYRAAIIYLRHHAQQTCLAVAPHCTVCPLRSLCAFASRRAQSPPRPITKTQDF
jgi:endonuclease III